MLVKNSIIIWMIIIVPEDTTPWFVDDLIFTKT